MGYFLLTSRLHQCNRFYIKKRMGEGGVVGGEVISSEKICFLFNSLPIKIFLTNTVADKFS